MTDFSKFGFDPEAMRAFFERADFTNMMEGFGPAGMDPAKLWESQQKNLEALTEANRTAATGFQAIFAKQLAMLNDTMADAREQLSNLTPGKAADQSEALKASFEKTMQRMQDLAETAQQANGEAFEIVSKRVQASMDEMRAALDGKKS